MVTGKPLSCLPAPTLGVTRKVWEVRGGLLFIHLLLTRSFLSSRFIGRIKCSLCRVKEEPPQALWQEASSGDLFLTLSLTTPSSGPGPASSQHCTIDKGCLLGYMKVQPNCLCQSFLTALPPSHLGQVPVILVPSRIRKRRARS